MYSTVPGRSWPPSCPYHCTDRQTVEISSGESVNWRQRRAGGNNTRYTKLIPRHNIDKSRTDGNYNGHILALFYNLQYLVGWEGYYSLKVSLLFYWLWSCLVSSSEVAPHHISYEDNYHVDITTEQNSFIWWLYFYFLLHWARVICFSTVIFSSRRWNVSFCSIERRKFSNIKPT